MLFEWSWNTDIATSSFSLTWRIISRNTVISSKLKYLSKSDYTEKKAQEQWDEAVGQINGYAAAPKVEALRQGTQLHKIIIQFCGWDMIKMREVMS